MKPNQEISLKFWIAMIVFFAVVLSIPLMSYLIDKKVITYDDVSAFYFVCFTTVSCFYMILVLRHSELKQKLSKEAFFNKVSAQTITDYDNQIKAQESKINDLKQAFEDAVAEITELRVRNKLLEENEDSYAAHFVRLKNEVKLLESCNQDNLRSIKYWKERALHQKHTKKVVDSDMWECIENYGVRFIKGIIYSKSEQNPLNINFLMLNDDAKRPFMVEKSHFKPVKC